MPTQKGFSVLIILVILAILAASGFFAFKYLSTQKSPAAQSTPTSDKTSEEAPTLIQPKLTYEGAYNGPLCDASSKMGDSAPLNLHIENMDRNGVTCFIAYVFAQEMQDLSPLAEPLKKYPGRIIPFFASGLGGDEAEPLVGDKLTAKFEDGFQLAEKVLGKGVVKGIGEVETQQWALAHNDPKVLQLFDFANAHNLNVMFHPVPEKITQVGEIAQKYPDTKFLIHMYQQDFVESRSSVISLLKENKNLYFTIDIDHLLFDQAAGTGLLYKYQDDDLKTARDEFVKDFDSKYQTMLKNTLAIYKPLIEAAPDQVVVGSEMNIRYTYEPEVYDRMIKFVRLFIGSLDKSTQEKVAYQNTLGAFGN